MLLYVCLPCSTGSCTSCALNVELMSSFFYQEITGLRDAVSELELTVDMLERERDFYFNKLRAIELLCMKVCECDTFMRLNCSA